MLDFDLAAMYGVETRALNQAVKRNIERFPEDFMYRLTKGEFAILKSQNVTSRAKRPKTALPFAFTEQAPDAMH
ncbi:MAG: ORF6N domain-containing protein [Bacteroidaceae bacterium]|nr:ORF6N domain-containing protein [Bacteroidaceae bacterium]